MNFERFRALAGDLIALIAIKIIVNTQSSVFVAASPRMKDSH